MKLSDKGPTLEQVVGSLPLAQRRAVARRRAQLIEEEASLRELRRALGLTQVQVARGLNKGQHEISRMEQRGDMLLSTLDGFVRAMGGELELVCRFRDREPVRLKTTLAAKRTGRANGPRKRKGPAA
jgi:ParB-like chromosome segregation protein Spo0J